MNLFEQLKDLGANLSVKRKGLMVVSIPLLFQIVFTLFLGMLYAQAEKQAWQESQARLLMVRCNTIVWDLYTSGQILIAYSAMREEILLDRWKQRKAAIIVELDSLKKLSLEHPESAKAYNRIVHTSNRGVELLEKISLEVEKDDKNSGIDVFRVLPEIKPFLDSLNKEMEEVLTSDLKQQSKFVDKSESSRQLIAACLYIGVFVDTCLALALSIFFGRVIVGRLAVVADNTRRAKENRPLNESLQGADEIGVLDRQFHELVDALRESERIRTEFLSMTSHDIKTPLMSVEVSIELIERELGKACSANMQAELKAAKDNMNRVLELINDLLDLERGAQGKLKLQLEDLNVKSIVERTTKSIQALADRKNVLVKSELEPELEIVADRKRIEQVLVNLLGNAVKFSKSGSVVLIKCTAMEKFVEFRVFDSGIGVSEADREKVFERFEQTAAASLGKDQGSGLGLAISKAIVLAHNGEIGVDPNPEAGSQFWFRIKQCQEMM